MWSALRATVTSVAGMGTEVTCLVLFGIWTLGGAVATAALLGAVAAGLPVPLRV